MDRDAIDIAIKFGTFILGGIGAWKLVAEYWKSRRSHLRDDYRFAREFLGDLDANPRMHPYLKQKGYQAIVGETDLSADEAEYLLTLHDPARMLRNYVLARRYLDFRSTSASAKLDFKLRYKTDWSRRWRKWAYFVAYLLCYSTGVAPLLLLSLRMLSLGSALLLLVFSAPVFLSFGFAALSTGFRINRAEELVKLQDKSRGKAFHIVEQRAS